MPTGIEDTSQFPNLIAEMLSRGWSEDDVKQVVGLNMIRVIQQVEQVGIQIQRKMLTSTRLYTIMPYKV